MRPFAALLVLAFFALLVAPAAAQDAPVPADDAPLAQALARLDAGAIEDAIGLLEVEVEEGRAGPRERATLGALYVEIGLPRDALEVLSPLLGADGADPAVLYNAGRAALAVGEAERGEAYLRRSLDRQPISPAARLLGLRLGARGEILDAYRLLRPWALATPGDAEARQAAAAAALGLGRVVEAEELLQGLEGADDPRSRLLRADLALKRRDAAAALEQLEPLLAAPPPQIEVDLLALAATAHLELGRSAEAAALLDGKTDGRPRLALLLARARHVGGDVDAALATLAPFVPPVLAAAPETLPPPTRALAASVALEQGKLLLAAGKPEDAAAALEQAAALDPWSREAHQELARARAATGDREGAERALARFRELAEASERAEVPGLAGRRKLDDATGRRLAEALEWLERGEPDRALVIARQEISLAPRDLRPRLAEVRALLALERLDEALASIDAALELEPEHPDARHFRAVVHAAMGDLEAAEADLRAVLAGVPGHRPAKNELAWVLARRGERAEARRLYEEILVEHPDDLLARQRLESLENAPGEGG